MIEAKYTPLETIFPRESIKEIRASMIGHKAFAEKYCGMSRDAVIRVEEMLHEGISPSYCSGLQRLIKEKHGYMVNGYSIGQRYKLKRALARIAASDEVERYVPAGLLIRMAHEANGDFSVFRQALMERLTGEEGNNLMAFCKLFKLHPHTIRRLEKSKAKHLPAGLQAVLEFLSGGKEAARILNLDMERNRRDGLRRNRAARSASEG